MSRDACQRTRDLSHHDLPLDVTAAAACNIGGPDPGAPCASLLVCVIVVMNDRVENFDDPDTVLEILQRCVNR